MGKTCLLIFQSVLVVLFTMTGSAMSLNTTTDLSSLLALKAHIKFDPQNVLANWSATTSFCNWIGISCSVRHERVTAFNLPHMGLVGTIAPHIGNLSFLSFLNIRNNSFNGNLPNDLARLRRLKVLNLRSNNFSGRVPSRLGDVHKLQALDMGNNQLTGPLPSTIFNISSLETIDISGNSIIGTLSMNICDHLPHLNTLYFHYNQLSGQIPSGLDVPLTWELMPSSALADLAFKFEKRWQLEKTSPILELQPTGDLTCYEALLYNLGC